MGVPQYSPLTNRLGRKSSTAAAAAAQLGRKEQAARYVDALRRRVPFLDLETVGSRFKDPSHPRYLREGLKASGL